MEFRVLKLCDLHQSALDCFDRYQKTRQVKYLANGKYRYKYEYFVEDWDKDKKQQVIQALRKCLQSGGAVVGAYTNGRLVGFASIEGHFLGTDKQYLKLSYIHVSREYRYQGIGRRLFQLCCEQARCMGAKKLYIGAHPSLETQCFYEALGCVPAAEIVQEIYEKQPLDIQLEYLL